jgi:hypothetical protein
MQATAISLKSVAVLLVTLKFTTKNGVGDTFRAPINISAKLQLFAQSKNKPTVWEVITIHGCDLFPYHTLKVNATFVLTGISWKMSAKVRLPY